MSIISPSERASKLKQHAESSRQLRPVLTSINGNVAWLISFPRPSTDPSPSGKKYYHTLMDPWFGEEVIFGSYYFLRMHLAEQAAMKDRNDVEQVIHEIELAAGAGNNQTKESGGDSTTLVDAIFIAGRVEHCSQPSITQFSPQTPVFVASVSHAAVVGWNHFDTIVELKNFMPSYTDEDGKEKDKCWTNAPTGSPLPSWLCATMLQTSGLANNFFTTVIIYTSQNERGEDVDEAIVLAPHGVSSAEQSITTLFKPSPSPPPRGGKGTAPKLLALLAPLNQSFQLNTQVTLGSDEALAVAQYPEDGCKYFVPNGDTPLVLGGLLSLSQSYVTRDLEWGRQQLMMGKGANGVKYHGNELKMPTETLIGNGETFILA